MKIKIENITLLPLDGRASVYNACIHIDSGKILYAGGVDTAPPWQAERTINGRGRLAMPGLVNAHTHVAMTLLRGVGTDLNLQDWLTTAIFPREDRLTPQDVYWGNMLGIMEMLRFGVTGLVDMYFPEDMLAKAVGETGIRAAISRGIVGAGAKDASKIEENVALYKEYNGAFDGRLHVLLGPHAEYTCDEEMLRMVVDASDKLGCGIHIHLSETAKETKECIECHGKTPTKYLADLGMFNRHAVAAHCVHITPEDALILADKGVYIAHNPISNLKLGSGVMPLHPHLLHRTALGTDGAASNNTLSVLEEVRMAGLLHKGVRQNPTLLPAKQVLTMACANGAAAMGFKNVGMLCAGMRADLILLDMDGPHATPAPDLTAHVVYGAQGSDVSLTMVDGKVLYEDGEYLTLDAQRVRSEATACAGRIGGSL